VPALRRDDSTPDDGTNAAGKQGRSVLFLICGWKNRLVEGTLVWTAFVVADGLLYKFLPDVTICYKCYAQYRQVTPNPDNQPFELGLAEKYDPLDKRPNAENPAAEWKGR
jgi:hypothetical protein